MPAAATPLAVATVKDVPAEIAETSRLLLLPIKVAAAAFIGVNKIMELPFAAVLGITVVGVAASVKVPNANRPLKAATSADN